MLDYPIIDLHTHLREDIPGHTKIARDCGIDTIVYMANTQPPLDTLDRIRYSLAQVRYCQAIPVSALTKDLMGKELVDVKKIRKYVVGFSDDGKYVEDLHLLEDILEMDVLVLAHCSPPYEDGRMDQRMEARFIERYLPVLEKTGGRLHVQHVSTKESVALIKSAKEDGLHITCETCPHYFMFSNEDMDLKVNPPLGTRKDVETIREGLANGTIDVIASDYAPPPRITGIAGFRSFIPLSYGLVINGILSEEQLKDKLFANPKKIIESTGYLLDRKD
jgi:dihydroorotase